MPFRALIIGLLGLALGAVVGFTMLASQWDAPRQQVMVQSTGEAKIGGPFELVDQNGKTRTEKDFRGQVALVFFGFLFCPDVCPATLQVIDEALDQMGEDQKKITPIFISVDPERDTPEALKQYLSNFNSRFVGLTGSAEQVKAAAKAYRIYYKRVNNSEMPGSYTMDHSSIIYVMGPNGKYRTHFTHGSRASEIAKRLKALL